MDTNFLNELEGRRILVTGEVGFDEYIWGDTWRISPEAPVPVVEVDRETTMLGLSANVALNIESLGAKATLVSVCGEDKVGDQVASMLKKSGIDDCYLIRDTSRPTLRKIRVIAQKQHVVRIDHEKTHPVSPSIAKEYREKIGDELAQCDGVIIEDYGKGLITSEILQFVKQAKQLKKPVFVDPNRHTPMSIYQDITLSTPNLLEAESFCQASHVPADKAAWDDSRLKKMAIEILEATHAEHSIITCGPAGMISFSRENQEFKRIPSFAREVFDVTGAGDTVISVMSLMYVSGHPLAFCMQVANAAAGLVVGRMGAGCVTKKELANELNRLDQCGQISS